MASERHQAVESDCALRRRARLEPEQQFRGSERVSKGRVSHAVSQGLGNSALATTVTANGR